jgi:hypothetical protein
MGSDGGRLVLERKTMDAARVMEKNEKMDVKRRYITGNQIMPAAR